MASCIAQLQRRQHHSSATDDQYVHFQSEEPNYPLRPRSPGGIVFRVNEQFLRNEAPPSLVSLNILYASVVEYTRITVV